jgi:hypothetical protein
LNETALNVEADALAAAAPYISLHSAAADAAGSNESAAPRVAAAWPAAVNGDLPIAGKSFAGGDPSGPVVEVGLWSQQAPGGTFYGSFALTGDATFNAAGEYTVNQLVINGSST